MASFTGIRIVKACSIPCQMGVPNSGVPSQSPAGGGKGWQKGWNGETNFQVLHRTPQVAV